MTSRNDNVHSIFSSCPHEVRKKRPETVIWPALWSTFRLAEKLLYRQPVVGPWRFCNCTKTNMLIWGTFLLITFLASGVLHSVESSKTKPSGPTGQAKASASTAAKSKSDKSNKESKPVASEMKTVFSVLFHSVDSFLNYVDLTLGADLKTQAFFRAERLDQTQVFTADGPDFTRPIGLVVKSNGETLLPFYFFPVKENVARLNNIVVLPQIFLPIKDEYGPTNRYQIRQDIPVLGGFHIFYWPLEPLLAQEQNGWIWVTTMKGFDVLPKKPLDLLPGFRWNEGEILQMKFNGEHLPRPLGDGLLQIARAVVCDAPKAMWSEKNVGPQGSQWGNVCYQYALRVLHGTESVELSCLTRKTRMTLKLDWHVDPRSDWAQLFKLQTSRPENIPILQTLYPDADIPEAFRNILLTDDEKELLHTIQSARKVSRSPEWFWPFNLPDQSIRQGRRQGLVTETLSITPQGCTLVCEMAGAFSARQIASSRNTQEEQEKKMKTKTKEKKTEQFDITF